MLPITLLCYGAMTVVAAAGYTYKRRFAHRRRRSASESSGNVHAFEKKGEDIAPEPSVANPDPFKSHNAEDRSQPATLEEAESAMDDTVSGTLKRKATGDDYVTVTPSRSSSPSPARKRLRSPSESDTSTDITAPQESSSGPSSTNVSAPSTPEDTSSSESDRMIEAEPQEKMIELTSTSEQSAPTFAFATRPVITAIESPIPRLSSPVFGSTTNTSEAFAPFAGRRSPFPVRDATKVLPESPASSVFASTPEPQDFNAVDVYMEPAANNCEQQTPADVLTARASEANKHVCLTGEEDEDVKAEIKGAKLYIKRGEKQFTSGITGHVKLLVHRKTGYERLLFRRDTVWKVSMSVRLRPTVRCSYDSDSRILRVILKQPIEQQNVDPQQRAQELVVYALTPGKTPKQDFEEFASAVVSSPQLN